MSGIFIISKGIFDDEELDIYEKMAFIVINGYMDCDVLMDELFLSNKMGCGIISVKKAIKGLQEKGILELLEDETIDRESVFINRRNVIKPNDRLMTEEIDFESYFEKFPLDKTEELIKEEKIEEIIKPKENIEVAGVARSAIKAYGKTNKKKTSESIHNKKSIPEERYISPQKLKIDLLKKIIMEPLTDSQIMIIYNIAGGDIALIKEKYKIAVYSQINDKIGLLMAELQKVAGKGKDNRLNNQINYEAIEYIKKQNGDDDDGEY